MAYATRILYNYQPVIYPYDAPLTAIVQNESSQISLARSCALLVNGCLLAQNYRA